MIKLAPATAFIALVSIMSFSLPLVSCSSLSRDGYSGSSQFRDGRFHNAEPVAQPGFWRSVVISWKFLTKNIPNATPERTMDIRKLDRDGLLAAPDNSLWKLGHSTILLKLDGKYWLTDPVFSERASPYRFLGPKRFHEPPISLVDLPQIEAVILSHDHYDHLDKEAITALAPKVQSFITPLGVGERLISWGVPSDKVKQLDWWQELEIGRISLAATPARHFSGRSVGDRNRTLWSSWVLITPQQRLFFSGDTGYFEGFKRIGEQFGPFDLTMMEAGAYDKEWPDTHMTPEESVQAHIDLKGRWMLPIHNGTFDLAFHPWTEPLERVLAVAKTSDVDVLTPRFGERVSIAGPKSTTSWWH